MCGKSFMPSESTSKQRFCSKPCQYTARRIGLYTAGRPVVDYAPVICEQCRQVFPVKLYNVVNVSNGSPRRFCSRACKGMATKAWPIERTNQKQYTCAECGKQWHGKSAPSVRDRKKYCSKECVGAAVTQRLRTESPTSIEAETYAALADMGIVFLPQHRIGRWVTDAYLPDLRIIVECQGDFYHCNPERYPGGPHGVIQLKTVERDARRLIDLTEQGYRVVNLWEADIRKRGATALLREALAL